MGRERLPNRVRRAEVAALARNSVQLQHTLIVQLCINSHEHSPFENAAQVPMPSLAQCVETGSQCAGTLTQSDSVSDKTMRMTFHYPPRA